MSWGQTPMFRGLTSAFVLRVLFLVLSCAGLAAQGANRYPFATSAIRANALAARVALPAGYSRPTAADGSFGGWLRGLPLKPGRPDVRLFDGRLKSLQSVHHAVVDIDTGTRDLQQCADAIMRLRAEYLFASGHQADIAFKFTSGDLARWTEWSRGMRPAVTGQRVSWRAAAATDDSYPNFRRYLDTVFTYAGSHSLEKELAPVRPDRRVAPGDVFIQGGFPGHAVMVVDVAHHADGSTIFLLAQSYMPAQDIHVLVNPRDELLSPWYRDARTAPLVTPEWTFPPGSLRQFTGLSGVGLKSAPDREKVRLAR